MSACFLRCLLAVAAVASSLITWSQVVTVYPNQDFEAPALGLGLWPADSRSTLNIDRQVAYSGKQSLRIDAPDAGQRAFALVATQPSAEVFPPETFFTISVMVRKSPGVENRAEHIDF
ncbi:MAG: hypothetical protein GX937_08060 [Lentisphaerae bacterium]|jgi:hypothetical protein|nr:hypothetical protein [Lentisphaerota bacterium]